MFATDKTNFLIIDTCTLLQCADLIKILVATVYVKKLNFKIVIPTIVTVELTAQEVCMQDSTICKSYLHVLLMKK
jgi:hypothetical protein